MGKIKIVLLRHGETLFNTENKVQGWGDSFITPNGLTKIKEKGEEFLSQDLYFDKIYTSDSGRTLETTRVIANILNINKNNIILNSDLREYNYGIFEGQNNTIMETAIKSEILEKNAEVFKIRAIKKDPTVVFDALNKIDLREKNSANTWFSETFFDYSTRILKGLRGCVTQSVKEGDNVILLVTHGNTMAALLGILFPEQLRELFKETKKINNGGEIVLSYDKDENEFALEEFIN